MRGLGLGLGDRRPSGGGVSYSTDAQAFFDLHLADGGTLTGATKALLDTWFVASAAYRPHIARLGAFINDAASLNGALVPLVNRSGNAKDTNHNFVAADLTSHGLHGNGTTKYLDTGFDMPVLSMGSHNLGLHTYLTTNEAFDNYACAIGVEGAGSDQAGLLFINAAAPNDLLFGILGNSAVASIFEPISNVIGGLYSIQASDAGDQNARCFFNGAGLTAQVPSTPFANPNPGSFYVFARNSVGSPTLPCPITQGAYVITKGMTVAELAAMYADLHTFMQGLGRVA